MYTVVGVSLIVLPWKISIRTLERKCVSYMDSCDGNGQHYMGGYTETSVLFMHTPMQRKYATKVAHRRCA